MMIFLTGSTGFIGKYFLKYFEGQEIRSSLRGEETNVGDALVVIHLAGKAQDLRNTSTPEEYYQANTALTSKVYDAFLASDAKVFITLSSVKAIADDLEGELTEEHYPNPVTHYGKSKFLAERHILASGFPDGKRVYILRPCMIHGPGNKGNLILLHNFVSMNIPWPLGLYQNSRSYCSVDNLMFLFKELISREDIASGVYNVADDEPLSTNDIIGLIAQAQNKKPMIWNCSKKFIDGVAFLGDKFHLPLNSERLSKLTSSYVVSTLKINSAIGKPLPVSSSEGFLKTLKSMSI